MTPEPLLRAEVEAILARAYADWQLGGLEPVGGGLEFLVYRTRGPELGDVAIKVPRAAHFANDNDPSVPACRLLEQEAECVALATEHGLPVPRVVALVIGEHSRDFLVQTYIAHDDVAPDPHDMGHLVGSIHALPLPPWSPVAQGGAEIETVIAERLCRRAEVVERISGARVCLPDRERVEAMLRAEVRPRVLLHMDSRPANILVRDRRIAAIVDWSNALIGDPWLELDRIAECGLLGDELLRGYATAKPLVPKPSAAIDVLYRLDAAVMLGVVFLSELPDAELGRDQVARILELCSELAGCR